MRRRLTIFTLALALVTAIQAQSPEVELKSTGGASSSQQATEQIAPAGSALSTIFSPARAPKRKTMGLLQRSFLDLATQGDLALEVAIVVDGTDSMTTELAGVRQRIGDMMEDLRRSRNNGEVRAAIVVYRDAGSPSGEVEIPLKKFSSDEEEIEKAVQSLRPESGAPFFHELPDLGLHRALTELPWSDDDQVTKWILMFGDAPPYAEAFKDAKTPEAYRRYATPLLVSIAKRKNIRINCVLCTSSDNVVKPYNAVIDQTRRFMNTLSAGTDGLMLDLSDPQIRTALAAASKQPEPQLVKIDPIGEIDLAAVRRENIQPENDIQQVSLAVIPHQPLDRITFDTRDPAVLVSTALRTKLASVAGVRVASPLDIKKQLRRLRAEGIRDDAVIRGLAARLGVDYVVWGTLRPDGATYQSAAYRRDDGQQIVSVPLAGNSGDMAYMLVEASAKNSGDEALLEVFRRMEVLKEAMVQPMSDDATTHRDLLTAIEALDQALGFEAGSKESVGLLETARIASEKAAKADRRNSLAHWLQANVAYNQASRHYQQGDVEAAAGRRQAMTSSLQRAANPSNLARVKSPSLVTEILADYNLLIVRDADKAVEYYTAMTKPDQPSKSRLRGHWMLSGIYAGDWGNAEKEIVDAGKARRHITEILANWPDSPQAALLKVWLHWDDRSKQTEFNYLPMMNTNLIGA
jgi:hypothetical protein